MCLHQGNEVAEAVVMAEVAVAVEVEVMAAEGEAEIEEEVEFLRQQALICLSKQNSGRGQFSWMTFVYKFRRALCLEQAMEPPAVAPAEVEAAAPATVEAAPAPAPVEAAVEAAAALTKLQPEQFLGSEDGASAAEGTRLNCSVSSSTQQRLCCSFWTVNK